MELFIFLRINHRADNICRKQIWSELNTAVISINQLSQRLDCKSLSQPWHTFKKNVPVAKQADKQRVYQMTLAYDDTIHTGHQICYETTLLFNPPIQFADIN